MTALGAEVGSRRGPTGMFLGRNGNGKPEDSCLGDTMGVGSSDIYFGDSREGYKLTDSLGLEYGAELGLYGFRVSGE